MMAIVDRRAADETDDRIDRDEARSTRSTRRPPIDRMSRRHRVDRPSSSSIIHRSRIDAFGSSPSASIDRPHLARVERTRDGRRARDRNVVVVTRRHP